MGVVSYEIKDYKVKIGVDCFEPSTRAEIVLRGQEGRSIGSIVFWDRDENIFDDSITMSGEITMNLNISMLHDVIDLLRHSSHIHFSTGHHLNRAMLEDGNLHFIGTDMEPIS